MIGWVRFLWSVNKTFSGKIDWKFFFPFLPSHFRANHDTVFETWKCYLLPLKRKSFSKQMENNYLLFFSWLQFQLPAEWTFWYTTCPFSQLWCSWSGVGIPTKRTKRNTDSLGTRIVKKFRQILSLKSIRSKTKSSDNMLRNILVK